MWLLTLIVIGVFQLTCHGYSVRPYNGGYGNQMHCPWQHPCINWPYNRCCQPPCCIPPTTSTTHPSPTTLPPPPTITYPPPPTITYPPPPTITYPPPNTTTTTTPDCRPCPFPPCPGCPPPPCYHHCTPPPPCQGQSCGVCPGPVNRCPSNGCVYPQTHQRYGMPQPYGVSQPLQPYGMPQPFGVRQPRQPYATPQPYVGPQPLQPYGMPQPYGVPQTNQPYWLPQTTTTPQPTCPFAGRRRRSVQRRCNLNSQCPHDSACCYDGCENASVCKRSIPLNSTLDAMAPKVTVTVLLTSGSSYSAWFLKNHLQPLFYRLQYYINIELISYGIIQQNGQCQYGSGDCFGNWILSCSRKYIGSQQSQLNFATCLMQNNHILKGSYLKHVLDVSKKCIEQDPHSSYTWSYIRECAKKGEGYQLFLAAGQRQHSIIQYVQQLPVVAINEVVVINKPEELIYLTSKVCQTLSSIPGAKAICQADGY